VKHLYKKLLFLLFALQWSGLSFAQDMEEQYFVYKHTHDTLIWNTLQRSEPFLTLDSSSKEMFYWVNYLRRYPARFFNQFVIPYTQQFPEVSGLNVQSLKTTLLQAKKLPFVSPSAILNQTATSHARDLILHQSPLEHHSTNGNTFEQRMRAAGVNTCSAQNLILGSEDPLESIILLLIDNGVPGLGHRANLLNKSLVYMGTSVLIYNDNWVIMVQDFSCK
jgi:Cysteine-rich secretory protein family